MNLSITSYELWLRTCSLVSCGLLIQHIVACQTAESFEIRKFNTQRYFLFYSYH